MGLLGWQQVAAQGDEEGAVEALLVAAAWRALGLLLLPLLLRGGG
jgi:hypothetical protein